MTLHEAPWRVRILDSRGRPHGCGVLITPELVLTCAHVVSDALAKEDPTAPALHSALSVNFPTVPGNPHHAAHILADSWLPVAADDTGDLAILRFDKPVDIRPANIAPCGLAEYPVQIYGHPGSSNAYGRWISAVTSGRGGPGNEWVQLTGAQQAGPFARRGYSGAGVVDADGAVIGILVSVDTEATERLAWMIPVELTALRIPRLTPLLDRHLDPEDTIGHHLVEMLLVLDRMDEEARRSELVGTLHHLLDRPSRAPRSEEPRTDLTNLVVYCLELTEVDGLDMLTKAVRRLYGDTVEVRQMTELLLLYPTRRLTRRDHDRIEALYEAVPPEDVIAASAVAYGPLGPVVTPNDVNRVIRELADLTGNPNYAPPLLIFLHHLADSLEGDLAGSLVSWVNEIAQRWHIPASQLRMPEAKAVTAPPQPHVVVVLRPDGPRPDLYQVSIWLQYDDGEGQALRIDDTRPLSIGQVLDPLAECLWRLRQYPNFPFELLDIEFVLPDDQLSHPVDTWTIAIELRSQPVGRFCPVVVRSLDRIRNETAQASLRRRSRWAASHGTTHGSIAWVTVTGATGESLSGLLHGSRYGLTDEHPVAVVLLAHGARANQALPARIQEGLHQLGIPVLVWCRDANLSNHFAGMLASYFQPPTLSALPRAVLEMRRSVVSNPARNPGEHVSLLWDDAGRLPPGAPLRAPALRRS